LVKIEENKIKIIYEDSGKTKFLKGVILEETEFLYKLKAEHTGDIISIGKRSIVKVAYLKDGVQ